MSDLLDIAPSTQVDVVNLDGRQICVRSLGADAIASIIARFPALKSLATGDTDNLVPRLIETCGASVGPIIAAGCGHLGDERYEQYAAKALLAEKQVEFLNVILAVTFPNGISSFIEQLARLVRWASGGAEEKQPIKMRSRRSPSPSQSSSEEASRPIMQ